MAAEGEATSHQLDLLNGEAPGTSNESRGFDLAAGTGYNGVAAPWVRRVRLALAV